LPAGSLLLVNPGPKSGETRIGSRGLEVGVISGTMASASAVAAEADHPLLAGVDFQALLVDNARRIVPASWLVPLVEAGSGELPAPLLLAGERDGRRVAVLMFDPHDSNLPKLAAFPLLMANVVDWLYPLAGAQALRPGEAALVAPGSRVTTPDGRSVRTGESGMFADTDMQGIYRIEGSRDPAAASGAGMFAVNMTDKAESDNHPRPHPELERPASGTAERLVKQEQWPPLAAIALALLGAEWLFYCWKRGSV
jgi:Ca-activated chloride channel family protein